MQNEYDIQVEYVNFPLHPNTPPQGISLADLFGGSAALPRIRESQKQLLALAAQEGLPMKERTMTYNSRLAQELGCWAESKGKGPQFHDAVFKAYFAEGQAISDPEVLAALARQVGLDPAEARTVLRERRYKETVDQQWAACENAGITGVPTFEVEGRRVVGAQPLDVLADLLEKAGATKRAAQGN